MYTEEFFNGSERYVVCCVNRARFGFDQGQAMESERHGYNSMLEVWIKKRLFTVHFAQVENESKGY